MGGMARLIRANPETNECYRRLYTVPLPHLRLRCVVKNEPWVVSSLAGNRAPCRETNATKDSGRDELSKCNRGSSWLPKLPLSASFELIEIREMRLNVKT